MALVPEHYQEVAARRIAHVDKTLAVVHERLSKEIKLWSDRWLKLKDDQAAGNVPKPGKCPERTVADLEGRLDNRKRELLAMRHVTSATPVALGGALVALAGLLRRLREAPTEDVATFAADAAARARIEKLAMDAVRRVEEAQGCTVVDVAAQKCGWDLTFLSADCGRQTAGYTAHRGEGTGADGKHRHHQPQRDTLRTQPGRQISAGDRAGGRRGHDRWPLLPAQPVRRRTGLGLRR